LASRQAVLFVKAGEAAIPHGSAGAEPLEAETPVALGPDGPFTPLARALRENGAIRDALASEQPSLRGYRTVRIAIAAMMAGPILMLAELDRELFARAGLGRFAVDALMTAWVGFELSRKTPRHPRVAAACSFAIALRWSLAIAKGCGHAHPLVWAAMGLAMVGALLFALRVPGPARVTEEIAKELGVTPHVVETRAPPPAVVAAAVACAAGLPALLHALRGLQASFVVQAMAFVGFAVVAPIGVRRFGDRPARSDSMPMTRVMVSIAMGLALTAAAVTCGRLILDTGTELASCVSALGEEARLARVVESRELATAVERVRASVPLVLLTAFVFPYAEERIYRGLLQDVLVRKFGARYGIFAASVAFGLAHIGVYEVALYQTVLLGFGFGLAYAEGGLWAAFCVHATWNLLQMG
jgi:membrane protease YdiL (CAAX protease family)